MNAVLLTYWMFDNDWRLQQLSQKAQKCWSLIFPVKVEWLMNTLLPRTLCFKHTLCSLEHFTPQHILLPETLCFSTQFAPWNTLLPRTLYSKAWYSFSSDQGSKVFQEANCSRQQSVPRNKLRSKMFWEVKCVREQSVLRSKVFQQANCSREQTVSRSKIFQGAKCIEG